jgi:hypothetical protein
MARIKYSRLNEIQSNGSSDSLEDLMAEFSNSLNENNHEEENKKLNSSRTTNNRMSSTFNRLELSHTFHNSTFTLLDDSFQEMDELDQTKQSPYFDRKVSIEKISSNKKEKNQKDHIYEDNDDDDDLIQG